MHYVYVLRSQRDSKLYYGSTEDLTRRLKQHNNGEVRATKPRRPFEVLHVETVEGIEEARRREKYFKSGFGRKYIKGKIKNTASSSNG